MSRYWRKPLLCGFFYFSLFGSIDAQPFYSGQYAVYFADKKEPALFDPLLYLSRKSIERRDRHSFPFDVNDLPVYDVYLADIEILCGSPLVTSKWLNAAVFRIQDSMVFQQIQKLPFVDSIQLLQRKMPDEVHLKRSAPTKMLPQNDANAGKYASNFLSLACINAQHFAEMGLDGRNVTIAVLDAGYQAADSADAFSELINMGKVVQTRDFVSGGSHVFHRSAHGTAVWGLIGGNGGKAVLGAATMSDYLLFRTEDVDSESKLEEIYWAAAMEMADSAGADIANSSLGYFHFDDTLINYTQQTIAESNSIVSRAARMAWERGIMVINSAGNEGNKAWQYTLFPAEVPEILTVGSVNSSARVSVFSSHGYSVNSTVKPDIVALGEGVISIDGLGEIAPAGNGTSFAAPSVAGAAACLAQAFPYTTNVMIKEAILLSADRTNHPDYQYGHGIPDFQKAYTILQGMQMSGNGCFIYPNPSQGTIHVVYQGTRDVQARVLLLSMYGSVVYETEYRETGILEEISLDLSEMNISSGVYQLSLHSSNVHHIRRLVLD